MEQRLNMGIGTFIIGSNLAAGQIVVIDINGNLKVLNEGEQPLPGEVVINSDGTVENQAEQPLQVEIVGENGENRDISAELEDIFAALEDGQDPTQLGEEFATAAGGNSGSSLTASGSVSRDGSETIAITNFDTQGLESLGLSQTQSLTLLEQYQNNAPVFIAADGTDQGTSLSVTTDEDTPLSGQFTALDTNGDNLTYAETTAPTNGTVTVNPDGSWVYTPNENYNGPDSFAVQVTDGQGGIDTLVVEIGVTPVNDPATVSDGTGEVVEDSAEQSVATGKLSIVDVDDGEAFVQPTSVTNDYGTFTIDAEGNWSFTINNESEFVQVLPEGEEIPLSFEVTSFDGTDTGTISVVVKGTNDSATVGDDSGRVKEDIDGKQVAEGQLSIQDVDTGEAKVEPYTVTNDYGTFEVEEDGSWK
ncbi:VCBS domain-containing protein, partial [Vibrio kyushuensis]|uniref:VCBS domain-containing protein n=1 Tax=Vibrio kyushuensis TaxID=2910249 RepID=UPI003D138681